MNIIKVAVPGPFATGLDYFLPTAIDDTNILGSRVAVSLGKRKVIGIVIGVATQSSCEVNKLKPILRRLDTTSIFDDKLWQLLLWMADYYHANTGDMFFTALPKKLKQGAALIIKKPYVYNLLNKNLEEASFAKAPKQKLAIELLKKACLSKEQLQSQGINKSILAILIDKGIIEKQEEIEIETPPPYDFKKDIKLNGEQDFALQQIKQNLDSFKAFLLFGVTGSGKTEVYLQAIAEVIKSGKQALVLIPEIGLTPQTVNRFTERFRVPVYVMNSALAAGKRLEHWLLAQKGQACIVIGTRSAVFMPLPNLGIVVVDEEHDQSFKQQTGVRYSARNAAIKKAQLANTPVILGSATPSLESWHNAKKNKYVFLQLSQRATEIKLPKCHIIDMRQQVNIGGLSKPLLTAIEQQLVKGRQVLLFLNRRGFAPVLLCSDCGWIAKCKNCETTMTVHTNPSYLSCHRCGQKAKIVTSCQQCDSSKALYQVGVGTEKLEFNLQQYFPNRKILRLDKDTVSRKGKLEQALKHINNGEVDIIIGTQLLAKGHHFSRVDMVGIIDIDNGLFSQDFRSLENIGQLILQVIGRAGRVEKQGLAYLQTLQPKHGALNCLLSEGYASFADKLLTDRQQADWPPFSFLASLLAEGKKLDQVKEFLLQVRKQLEIKIPNVDMISVYGPVSAMQQKKAGYYRQQLLLQSVNRLYLQQTLIILQKTLANYKISGVTWIIDVDPSIV